MQDREKRRTSLAVRLGSDLVEDERRRLTGSDQVLSHGRAQQQVDLLTRALGEQPGFSPDARPRLLDLDRQVGGIDADLQVGSAADGGEPAPNAIREDRRQVAMHALLRESEESKCLVDGPRGGFHAG